MTKGARKEVFQYSVLLSLKTFSTEESNSKTTGDRFEIEAYRQKFR